MITNIRLETTDEERKAIAESLGQSGMISRKALKEAVEYYVKGLTLGHKDEEEPEPEPQTPPGVAFNEDKTFRFVPSRGDEDYLYSGKDPELTAACSAVLDACENLDQVVWNKLEENRNGR